MQDEALQSAVEKAEDTVKKMVQDIENKKWKIVADNLKIEKVSKLLYRNSPILIGFLQPVTNFSQNACKTRFAALENGTAKATPESVLQPDDATLERIRARAEKERQIEMDKILFESKPDLEALAEANRKGNAWTSRPRRLT